MTEAVVVSLVRFLRALAVLALPAEQQLRWLNSLGMPGEAAIADELALEFGDGHLLVPQFVRNGWLPAGVTGKLQELDALLTSMSGTENAAIWEIEALKNSPEWDKVRSLASDVILAL